MAFAIDITEGHSLSNEGHTHQWHCYLLLKKSKVRNAVFAVNFTVKAL